MAKVMIDTDVYIGFFRAGQDEEVVLRGRDVKYMSAIVLMELYAGLSGREVQRGLLRDVDQAFARAGRIVSPSARSYRLAGRVLSLLRLARGREFVRRPGFSHDVLIALTAEEISATVVTRNRNDFEAIRSVHRFGLETISANGV